MHSLNVVTYIKTETADGTPIKRLANRAADSLPVRRKRLADRTADSTICLGQLTSEGK